MQACWKMQLESRKCKSRCERTDWSSVQLDPCSTSLLLRMSQWMSRTSECGCATELSIAWWCMNTCSNMNVHSRRKIIMSKQSYTKMHVLLRMGGYLPLPESLENIHCFYCVSMFAFSLPFTNTVVRPQNSVPLLDLLSSSPTVNQSIPTKYSGIIYSHKNIPIQWWISIPNHVGM